MSYENQWAECPNCGSQVSPDGLCDECEAKRQEIKSLEKLNTELVMDDDNDA